MFSIVEKLVEGLRVEEIEKSLYKVEQAVETARNDDRLHQFVEKLELIGSFLIDWKSGEYRKVPLKTVLMVAFSIVYLANPRDLVPREFPRIGRLNKAILLGLVLQSINSDLDQYDEWKTAAGDAPQPLEAEESDPQQPA